MSKENVKKQETYIYRLADLRDSSYYKDTKGDDTQKKVYLNAPGGLQIPSLSYRAQKDAEGTIKRIRIRYIKGCEEIDLAAQEKAGIKPDLINDRIWFTAGQLIVVDNGSDDGLVKFMKENITNGTAEVRPAGATIVYNELKQDTVAKEKLAPAILQAKATNLVLAMADQDSETNEWIYDTTKLDLYASIFKIAHLSHAEIADSLFEIARINPNAILDALTDNSDKTRGLMADAVKAGALVIEEKEAFVVKGDGSKESVLKFSKDAKTAAKRSDELMYCLMNPNGAPILKKIQIAIQEAKQAMLAT